MSDIFEWEYSRDFAALSGHSGWKQKQSHKPNMTPGNGG